jgi:hypothetical protein
MWETEEDKRSVCCCGKEEAIENGRDCEIDIYKKNQSEYLKYERVAIEKEFTLFIRSEEFFVSFFEHCCQQSILITM